MLSTDNSRAVRYKFYETGSVEARRKGSPVYKEYSCSELWCRERDVKPIEDALKKEKRNNVMLSVLIFILVVAIIGK